MNKLSPKARALLQTGRAAYSAQEKDRARIAATLRARLGPAALLLPDTSEPLSAAASAGVSRHARWTVLGGAAVGMCCIAASVVLWHGEAPRARVLQRPTAAPVQVVAGAPASAPAVLEVTQPTAAPKPARAAPVSVAPPDALAREVPLLERATRDIAEGRTAQALTALREHEKRFPHGLLTEERRAAKAQALCALGRVREGRSEQARLTPQSPSAARAKLVCDIAERRNGSAGADFRDGLGQPLPLR